MVAAAVFVGVVADGGGEGEAGVDGVGERVIVTGLEGVGSVSGRVNVRVWVWVWVNGDGGGKWWWYRELENGSGESGGGPREQDRVRKEGNSSRRPGCARGDLVVTWPCRKKVKLSGGGSEEKEEKKREETGWSVQREGRRR